MHAGCFKRRENVFDAGGGEAVWRTHADLVALGSHVPYGLGTRLVLRSVDEQQGLLTPIWVFLGQFGGEHCDE